MTTEEPKVQTLMDRVVRDSGCDDNCGVNIGTERKPFAVIVAHHGPARGTHSYRIDSSVAIGDRERYLREAFTEDHRMWRDG